MLLNLKLLLRVRKKITIIAISIFMLEIIFFVYSCLVHKKLDSYCKQLNLSVEKQKRIVAVVQQQDKVKKACFVNSKQAIAELKKLFAENNVSYSNISAIERTNDMDFRLSGSCDYSVFVTLLANLRKSRHFIRLNYFEIVFVDKDKLNYVFEIQAMRRP